MATKPSNSCNVDSIGLVGFTNSNFVGNIVNNHSILVGGSTSSTVTSLSVGSNNTLLQGSTGADPAFTGYPQISGLGIGASPGSTSGLTFDGTNFLGVYQTGSWTPNLQIGGSSTGIVYINQIGRYMIIGNVVFFYMRFSLSSKGVNTGNLTISNLPFTGGTNASSQYTKIAQFGSFTSAGYSSLSMNITNGSSVGTIFKSGSGVSSTNVTNSDIADTFLMFSTGNYILN